MKKYINPIIDIVKVDLLTALCNGSGVNGENQQQDSGIKAPARKLYV